MVLRLVRQTVTSISAAAAVSALRITSISTGPSGTRLGSYSLAGGGR